MTLPHLASLLVALPLLVFSLRRLIFTIAALASPQRLSPPAPPPSFPNLLVLIPCRDDGPSLPPLVDALSQNGYPPDHLRLLLIDDGSRSHTALLIDELTAQTPGAAALHLSPGRGKAAALNAALVAEPWGEIIAVYDADHRPQPGGLLALVAPFADPQVAAVSGRTEAANALVSASAYYSASERLVHQRLTMAAKDRLHLAPAILGSHCAYRRSVLATLGGFLPGAFLEDTDLTLRLAAAGLRTRFVESIPAIDQAPATLNAYWRQHVRWGRGFQDVALGRERRRPSGPQSAPPLSFWLRLELFLFSLGYLDRLALLAAAGLLLSDAILPTHFDFPAWFFIAVLVLPYLQVIAALVRTHKPWAWWLRLPFLLLIFPVDLLAAARSTLDTLLNRPRQWTPTTRTSP
ncbi:MAG: glycosyltransferase family 2 protein [Caldilineales bacterium]|nr:glycosyltransferase family 2 protein [Caldilineales bacterium]